MSNDIPKHLSPPETFEIWLADMDDAIAHFAANLPASTREALDFSPSSLDSLEAWLLQRYRNTDAMLSPQESLWLDGAARYIGETFRKAIGGRWEIRLDDPSYAFHGIPQLTGFWDKSSPVAPLTLATASADRRSGRYISGVLAGYLRQRQRKLG